MLVCVSVCGRGRWGCGGKAAWNGKPFERQREGKKEPFYLARGNAQKASAATWQVFKLGSKGLS